LTRLLNKDELYRNQFIEKMAEAGIATNVHYKPLPMHTAYKNMGFSINDYPNSYNQYCNEITLPLHTQLTNEEVDYIIEKFKKILSD
ncbi:DegT/DnrJ/EryC1/StrS family aminotransferase, partial [Avibacterium avium]